MKHARLAAMTILHAADAERKGDHLVAAQLFAHLADDYLALGEVALAEVATWRGKFNLVIATSF